MLRPRFFISLLLCSSVLTFAGCGGSARAQLEKFDPSAAAAKAFESFDRNNDGKLSGEEMKLCPSLLESGRRVDQNMDGNVTPDELQDRFAALDAQSDLIALDVQVTSKRRPLAGAEVTLIPEPFMGKGLQSYSGTTNDGGACLLEGDEVKIPGIPVGYYQAKIKHAG